jgi:hypothetical protein
MCQKRVLFVFRENYSMINSRVALRVVISGSIHISGAYLLAELFLYLMQTNCGGHRLGPARGRGPRGRPKLREESSGRKHSFLPRENGTK